MRNTLLALMFLGSFGTFAEEKHVEAYLHNPILVDVRTDAEWNDGYIETSIHIPLDKIYEKIELVTENKEQTIGSLINAIPGTEYTMYVVFVPLPPPPPPSLKQNR